MKRMLLGFLTLIIFGTGTQALAESFVHKGCVITQVNSKNTYGVGARFDILNRSRFGERETSMVFRNPHCPECGMLQLDNHGPLQFSSQGSQSVAKAYMRDGGGEYFNTVFVSDAAAGDSFFTKLTGGTAEKFDGRFSFSCSDDVDMPGLE